MTLGPRSKLGLASFLILSVALSCAYGWHLHARSISSRALPPEEAAALEQSAPGQRALWSIESLEQSRGRAFIKGWAIVPGGRFSNARSAFLLRDTVDGTLYELRSFTYERLDIGQTYTPNHEDYLYNFDHDFAGISATADLKSMPKGRGYEVMIRYDGGHGAQLIPTGRMVGEGAR